MDFPELQSIYVGSNGFKVSKQTQFISIRYVPFSLDLPKLQRIELGVSTLEGGVDSSLIMKSIVEYYFL